jgi:hypothetical protein
MANISNLKAGETWRFKAIVFQKDAAEVTRPEIYAK